MITYPDFLSSLNSPQARSFAIQLEKLVPIEEASVCLVSQSKQGQSATFEVILMDSYKFVHAHFKSHVDSPSDASVILKIHSRTQVSSSIIELKDYNLLASPGYVNKQLRINFGNEEPIIITGEHFHLSESEFFEIVHQLTL